MFTERIINLFWSRVDKNGPVPPHVPHLGNCWIWHGFILKRYGRFRPGSSNTARQVYAHRFSYEISIGKIPDELLVCHHCDTPLCVRPDHLFVGDYKANAEDCSKKERWPTGNDHYSHRTPERTARGERTRHAKLTEAQVSQIRNLYKGPNNGPSQYVLAKQFGVTQSNIGHIILGKTWNQKYFSVKT